MSLEATTNLLEFLLYVVPIIVLAIGVILYFLLKPHRKTLGIIIITLGVVGLAFFSLGVYVSVTLFFTVNTNLIFLLIIELITLLLGIIAYKNRLKEE